MEASEPTPPRSPPITPAEPWWTNSFMVTFAFRCNIACTFCMVEDALDAYEGTSVAAFRRFAADPSALGGARRVIFSGGEVTLAKDLLEYVAVARSLPGVEHVRLQTNAIRLGDRAFLRSLIDAGVDEYFVSFHAHDAELYEAIAQRKGAFAGIVRGLAAIRDSGATLITNTAVVEANYRVLPAIVAAAAAFGPRSIELWNYWPRTDGDGSRQHVARVADVRAPLLEALDAAVSRGIPPVVKWFPRCLLGPMAWCQDDGQPPALIEDGYWEQEPEYGCIYEGVCSESIGRPPERSGGGGKCAGLSDAYVHRFGWEERLLHPVRRLQAAERDDSRWAITKGLRAMPNPRVARSLLKDAGERRTAQARAAAWLAALGLDAGQTLAGFELVGTDRPRDGAPLALAWKSGAVTVTVGLCATDPRRACAARTASLDLVHHVADERVAPRNLGAGARARRAPGPARSRRPGPALRRGLRRSPAHGEGVRLHGAAERLFDRPHPDAERVEPRAREHGVRPRPQREAPRHELLGGDELRAVRRIDELAIEREEVRVAHDPWVGHVEDPCRAALDEAPQRRHEVVDHGDRVLHVDDMRVGRELGDEVARVGGAVDGHADPGDADPGQLREH